MNERIRELAQNAGLISSFNSAPHRPDIEKFAELIVRECAVIATEGDSDKIALGILQHFGVE